MIAPEKAMSQALEPAADPAWVLAVDGYDPLREGSLGSRFAISNGFLGVRGARALALGARWIVPASTYVAGLFDTPDFEQATPSLVPGPGWVETPAHATQRTACVPSFRCVVAADNTRHETGRVAE